MGFSRQESWSGLPFPSPGEGFPHSSVGKESACNAGDPGLIPGSGRSAGEGIDYPLQYSGLRILIQSSFFHTDSEQFYLQRLSLVKVCIWVPQTGNVLKTPQHMAERAFMLSCERDTW